VSGAEQAARESTSLLLIARRNGSWHEADVFVRPQAKTVRRRAWIMTRTGRARLRPIQEMLQPEYLKPVFSQLKTKFTDVVWAWCRGIGTGGENRKSGSSPASCVVSKVGEAQAL